MVKVECLLCGQLTLCLGLPGGGVEDTGLRNESWDLGIFLGMTGGKGSHQGRETRRWGGKGELARPRGFRSTGPIPDKHGWSLPAADMAYPTADEVLVNGENIGIGRSCA